MTEGQLDTINTIRHFATGIVTAFVLFTAMIQVIIARWWQVAIVKRGRMGKELQYIRLSHLAGVLFLASIIFSYLENRVVLDILPVLCLLFGAAGLSLIHYLCGLMGGRRGRFWLTLLYVALIYSMAMMAMLLCCPEYDAAGGSCRADIGNQYFYLHDLGFSGCLF